MGSLDGYFGVYNYGKLEGLLLWVSLGYSSGKVFGSDEGIKLGSNGGKVLFNIIVNIYGITLGIDIGTDLGSLDRSLHGSNDWNIKSSFLGGSLRSNDGKVIDSNESIKLGSTEGKVFGTILGNLNVITLGLGVGTDLGSLDGLFDHIHWILW